MTDIKETEQLEDLEGDVQSPEARTRTFKSTRELGEWIALIQPKVMQVQPIQGGGHVLNWRN